MINDCDSPVVCFVFRTVFRTQAFVHRWQAEPQQQVVGERGSSTCANKQRVFALPASLYDPSDHNSTSLLGVPPLRAEAGINGLMKCVLMVCA